MTSFYLRDGRALFFALASTAGAAALAAALVLGGCQPALYLGLQFVYDHVPLPEEQVRRDLSYWPADAPDPAPPKHRLNLFLPTPPAEADTTGPGWPTVIFVHGGGWTEGDKDLRVGYQDVYNNIGRFFARRGIGAAVVNYRLLSDSTAWPAQIEDVARATAFVHEEIGRYGGDPDALFLMGHSAGAQLAARVALDTTALGEAGVPEGAVCGVIPVSGAALDLTDERTYALSDDPAYYARRFDTRPDWQEAASPTGFVRPGAPPFLILFAGGESEALQRQSWLLNVALQGAGARSEVIVVPGKSHERIVPTLSRDDQTAGPAMLRFIGGASCG